ncbi:MAG TPA: NUDIX hydrolase N-terminal domain-containing protein [Microthrixaceae bacterium]|nr:NUDIX hydrolase N-terminal domain-containing protein [Microthrixaceae bacterium]
MADTSEPAPPAKPALTESDLLRWSESLAGIARTGLGFTASGFERERYEEVLHIAADIAAAAGRAHDPDVVVQEWLAQVGEGVAGYVTPKIAIGAVVGNDDGQILLIQRADSGIWLYPTGWADIGYSASEVAIKEVREETGIEVEVRRLIGLFDGLRLGFTTTPLYSLVFHCHAIGGELRPHPLEVLDARWFDPDDLPEPLARVHHWGEHALAAIRGDEVEVLYDHPRDSVWEVGD